MINGFDAMTAKRIKKNLAGSQQSAFADATGMAGGSGRRRAASLVSDPHFCLTG
jgi:hypothetical protein